MAKIGNIRDLVLYVRTNAPGNYPHFHIVDEATLGRLFHCCVRIDRAQYFKHTGKEDTLNSKRRRELIEFLQSPSEDEPEKLIGRLFWLNGTEIIQPKRYPQIYRCLITKN